MGSRENERGKGGEQRKEGWEAGRMREAKVGSKEKRDGKHVSFCAW